MASRRLAHILSHLRCSPCEAVDIGAGQNATSLACQRHPHVQSLPNGRRMPASECLCRILERKEAGEGTKCGGDLERENGEESLQLMQERSISRESMHFTGGISSEEGISDGKSTIDATISSSGCIESEDMSISGRELLLPSVSRLFCTGSSNSLDAARREGIGARDAADQRLAAKLNESRCVNGGNGKQSQHTRGHSRSGRSDPNCASKAHGNGISCSDSYHHKESGNCRLSGSDMRLEGHVVSDKKQSIALISNLEIAYNKQSDTACSKPSDADECNQDLQKIDTRVDEDFKNSPKLIVPAGAFSPQNSPPLRSRSKADESLSSGNRYNKPVFKSTSSQDCVFCNIVQGRSPAFKLYEDDHCICILDINPLCYGHSLIIPKAHFPSLEATPPQVAAAMCAVIPLISRVLMDATQRDAFNMVVNNGSAAGQVVFHTHFHIVPRCLGDGLWTAESVPRKHLKAFADPAQLAKLVRSKLSNA